MTPKTALPLCTLASVLLGGCAMLPGAGTEEMPVFVLEDQSRADTVDIASVTLVQPGFVVVHDDVDGAPGPVLGHSELLAPGTHENVSIALDTSGTGDGVWPMVHDDDGNETYEFPGADAPLLVEGTPVMDYLAWQ